MIAGYGPRWLDNALLLLFDTIRSFPTIVLALAAVSLLGPSLNLVLGDSDYHQYSKLCSTGANEYACTEEY